MVKPCTILCPRSTAGRTVAALIALVLVWNSACTSLRSRRFSPDALPTDPSEQITGITTTSGETILFDLSYAEEESSGPRKLRLLGVIDAAGAGRDIAVDGSVGYLAAGKHGLVIVDANPGWKPRALSRHDLPGFAGDVEVMSDGRTACVAAGIAGVHVLDVSTSGPPALLGTVETGAPALRLAVSGSRVFVAGGDAGISIIDLSDREQPVVRDLGVVGSAQAMVVHNGIAYVARGSDGLGILDVRDPGSPAEITQLDMPGEAVDVAVGGTIVYVAAGRAGLVTVDVSDLRAPVRLDVIDTPGTAVAVCVGHGVAYVANGIQGVSSVDTVDPAAMSEIDTFTYESADQHWGSTSNTIQGLALRGSRLYAACWGASSTGLLVFGGLAQTASIDADSLYARVGGQPFHIALTDIERVWIETHASDASRSGASGALVILALGLVVVGIVVLLKAAVSGLTFESNQRSVGETH